jgi:hypothetical protein
VQPRNVLSPVADAEGIIEAVAAMNTTTAAATAPCDRIVDRKSGSLKQPFGTNVLQIGPHPFDSRSAMHRIHTVSLKGMQRH